MVEQIGRDFVLQGANVLNTAWLLGYTSDRTFISLDQTMQIGDLGYNLKDRYDMYLAGAWIQTQLILIERKLPAVEEKQQSNTEELALEISKLDEELGLLSWLKRRGVQVQIGEETFGFFDRKEAVSMAHIFQALDRAGLSFPKRIEWCSSSCLDYLNRKELVVDEDGTSREVLKRYDGAASMRFDSVELTNSAHTPGLVHEIGHLLEKSDNYAQRFTRIRGLEGRASEQERLKFVSGYALTNEREDFAESFMFYLMYGDTFRQIIDGLHVYGRWEDASVLQEKYDLMKEMFRGAEFSQSAKPRDLEKERKMIEFLGISWIPQRGGSLEIRPNPNGMFQKRVYRDLPIIVGNALEFRRIYFDCDSQKRTYQIIVPPQTPVSDIYFYPLRGDDRVLVEPPKNFSRTETGSARSIWIGLGEEEKKKTVVFHVESFSAVGLGQHRLIRDNDFSHTGLLVALRSEAEILDQNTEKVLDGQKVIVVEGPKEAYDTYTQMQERFWKVRILSPEDNRLSGWVSQRWLGKESTGSY